MYQKYPRRAFLTGDNLLTWKYRFISLKPLFYEMKLQCRNLGQHVVQIVTKYTFVTASLANLELFSDSRVGEL